MDCQTCVLADHEAQAHRSSIPVTKGAVGAKDPYASTLLCPVLFSIFHTNAVNGTFHWSFRMLASIADQRNRSRTVKSQSISSSCGEQTAGTAELSANLEVSSIVVSDDRFPE